MFDMAGSGGAWSLVALAGLGAFHGINPAMGWLFAVALAMQEQRQRALWRGLAAIGGGHALATIAAVAGAWFARSLVPDAAVRWAVAALLIGLGIARLVRSRHPRVGGSMRIGFAGLVAWSFLMASAHGAGLMVLPLVIGSRAASAGPHAAHAGFPAADSAGAALTGLAVHAAAFLMVTAAIAWLVYTRVGVGLLRRAWINLDVIWAVALVVTGLAAVLTV